MDISFVFTSVWRSRAVDICLWLQLPPLIVPFHIYTVAMWTKHLCPISTPWFHNVAHLGFQPVGSPWVTELALENPTRHDLQHIFRFWKIFLRGWLGLNYRCGHCKNISNYIKENFHIAIEKRISPKRIRKYEPGGNGGFHNVWNTKIHTLDKLS